MEPTNPLDPVKQPGEENAIAAADDAAQPGGAVDIEAIKSKTNVPPEFKKKYDAIILSGMRIMFDKKSHESMFLAQLNKEGPLASKISEGVVALFYMLWEQSNKTIPPQLVIPVTFTLTLEAFDFCQQTGEPEATPETLGLAIEQSYEQILGKFGFDSAQIDQLVQKAQGQAGAPAPAAPDATQQPGMLDGGM